MKSIGIANKVDFVVSTEPAFSPHYGFKPVEDSVAEDGGE
jgi:hypothetical protein